MSISQMIQIARFMVFIIRAVRDLVVEVEQQMPEPGRGKEKFATVKRALEVTAKYAGISQDMLTKVDSLVNDEIETAVKEEINAKN